MPPRTPVAGVPSNFQSETALESFIAGTFSRAYGAQIEHFAEHLAGMRQPDGQWAAGVAASWRSRAVSLPSLPATMYKTNRASYITSMGFAIWPDGYGIVNIVGNLADHADDFGIFPYYDYDARMPVAHAKISKNRASANVDYGFYDENSYGAEWTGNEAEATTDGAGFYFYEPLHESIVNNQSNGNATDGFQIDGTSGYEPAAFKKNTATSNGGWGFWADSFVGGSGNLSVNNGSSCWNVNCSVS